MQKRRNLDHIVKRLLPWSAMSHVMKMDPDQGSNLQAYIAEVRNAPEMSFLQGEMHDALKDARSAGKVQVTFSGMDQSPSITAWNAFARGEVLGDAQSHTLIAPMLRMFESELISCLRDVSSQPLKASSVSMDSPVKFENLNANVGRAMRRFNDAVDAGTARSWYAPVIEKREDGTAIAISMGGFMPQLRQRSAGKTRFMTMDPASWAALRDREEEAVTQVETLADAENSIEAEMTP